MIKKIKIGTGVLGWVQSEFTNNRFGTITLKEKDGPKNAAQREIVEKYNGHEGILVVQILENRKPTLSMNLLLGLSPKNPPIGNFVELGRGTLFYELDNYTDFTVGLSPEDDRKSLWLDAKSLYQCHGQIVDLWFVKKLT